MSATTSTSLTGIPPPSPLLSLYDFVFHMPKVELHAHLNGCIRETTLFELADERNVILSPHHFGHSSTTPNNNNNKNKKEVVDNDNDNDNDPLQLLYNIRPRSLQDCFDMFNEIPLCVNDLSSLQRITQESLEDFATHNVAYLELRSTPKRLLRSHKNGGDSNNNVATKKEYVETIMNVMSNFERNDRERYNREVLEWDSSNNNAPASSSKTLGVGRPRLPMICRFIIAVDRSQSIQEANENIDLAIEIFQNQQQTQQSSNRILVGVDLGGNPTRGNFIDLKPVFERARKAGLKVTLHCGEVPCDDDVLRRKEAEAMIQFKPDRIGHALLLPEALCQQIYNLQIPIETCPTSNVMTLELTKKKKKAAGGNKNHEDDGNLIHGLQHHPNLQDWIQQQQQQQQQQQSKLSLCVCTDDPGVFDTTATQELLLLFKVFNLSREDLSSIVLKSIDCAFLVDGDEPLTSISSIKAMMKERIDQLLLLSCTSTTATTTATTTPVTLEDHHHENRPTYVVERIQNKQDLYYFGIGSNMLKSKIEGRSVCGTPIHLKSIEPAFVSNYRLAFNMRGFVPIEPGMGSIEPVTEEEDSSSQQSSSSKPLHTYVKPECHGSLIRLSYDNYERVMRSEGISDDTLKNSIPGGGPGYEEIVVEAVPYGDQQKPVQAIALRARSHVRLQYDPCPSQRYMNILREGARELGLKPEYQKFLKQHPVQQTPKWLKRLSINSLVFTFILSQKTGSRAFSKFQGRLLFQFYVPTTSSISRIKIWTSHIMIGCLLTPTACLGKLIQLYYWAFNKQDSMPPFLKRIISMVDSNNDDTKKNDNDDNK